MAKKNYVPKIWSKSMMVDALAEKAGLTKKQAGSFLDAYHDIIRENVGKGDKFRFVGFGIYEKKHREARAGRNPQTGEAIQIAASDHLGFRSNVAF